MPARTIALGHVPIKRTGPRGPVALSYISGVGRYAGRGIRRRLTLSKAGLPLGSHRRVPSKPLQTPWIFPGEQLGDHPRGAPAQSLERGAGVSGGFRRQDLPVDPVGGQQF